MPTDWFSKTAIDADTTMLTEPFVHDFVRANIWHVRGRDADLLVDTGMGIMPLAPHIDTPAGKPLIVVATHIHLDHVGSLHEFPLRAGPAQSAADFATMPDRATYADMYRGLDGAVARLPDDRTGGQRTTGSSLRRWGAASRKATPWTSETAASRSCTCRAIRLIPSACSTRPTGLFISGDAIYDSDLIDDLPDSDREAYRATMRRLLDLPIRIGHGGHGPSFDRSRMREIAADYLKRGEAAKP